MEHFPKDIVEYHILPFLMPDKDEQMNLYDIAMITIENDESMFHRAKLGLSFSRWTLLNSRLSQYVRLLKRLPQSPSQYSQQCNFT
jgi:hypothetical protein